MAASMQAPNQADRPGKSVLTAYVLWLLLGGLAAHRLYLRRPGSAIRFLILHAAGWAICIQAGIPDPAAPEATPHIRVGEIDVEIFFIGLFMLALCAVWLLADAVMIPSLVATANARLEEETGGYSAPVDLDPSPQAMRRKMRAAAEASHDPWDLRDLAEAEQGPAGLPEGYVLPWQRESETEALSRYSPPREFERAEPAPEERPAEPTEPEPERVAATAAAPSAGAAAGPPEPDPVALAYARNLYQSERKSVATAYLLWLITGLVGGHRLYLGTARGVLIGVSLLVGGAFLVAFAPPSVAYHWAGIAGLGLAVVWFALDGVTLPSRVRDYNRALMDAITREASGIRR